MARKPKVKPHQAESSPRSQERSQKQVERLEQNVIRNGRLVEDLLESEVWREILSPLIDETIASVSGRKTSGRWHHGALTSGKEDKAFLSGYQKCGMDINNRVMDFVKAKQDLDKSKAHEAEEKLAPIENPFLEKEDLGYEWQ